MLEGILRAQLVQLPKTSVKTGDEVEVLISQGYAINKTEESKSLDF